ncbi:hypothetical protein ThidrDRAFT_3743 [Thiorhodococcus drewsii AZ1]|uniref:Uncharacterized protein n=1 Tax=Thiorhodococcus drewsii AZ1 TaxID=765913 RepID=G2E630_9GAMM|nr:hypothetical protein [Thiorhodococcus drewsii]EGV28447.1 hypothetical protein ThidrDRAFT_3743 [Thiorhodococcus drewsii AZ1]
MIGPRVWRRMNSDRGSGIAALARVCRGWWLAVLLLQPLAVQAEGRVLRVIGDENYPPYLFLDADGKEDASWSMSGVSGRGRPGCRSS